MNENIIKWILILTGCCFVCLLWLAVSGCSEPSELEGYYSGIMVNDEWQDTEITLQRGYYFFEDLEPQRYDSLATDKHGNTLVYRNDNILTITR